MINNSTLHISGQLSALPEIISRVATKQESVALTEWRQENRKEIANLTNRIDETIDRSDRHNADQRVLDSLYYAELDDREQSVTEAHGSTFRWLFDEVPSGDVQWTGFTDWLRGDTSRESARSHASSSASPTNLDRNLNNGHH